jgi:pimeloyl-ACP methyl ester carboxylesterase
MDAGLAIGAMDNEMSSKLYVLIVTYRVLPRKNTVSKHNLPISGLEIIFDAMQGIISHPDYETEYLVFGEGPRVLFAFHGFNNRAEDFRALGIFLGKEYKIVALNLFFHGASRAREELVERGFSAADLKEMFLELTDRFPAEQYTLLGFSLGGRIVLKIVELFPEKTGRVVLLAPDGIRISSFYRFLTGTRPGRWLFRKAVSDPFLFSRIALFLRKTNVVNEKRYQFALKNFDTNQKREQVYLIWMIFRKIFSDRKAMRKLIKKYEVRFDLFFGAYDKIIPPAIGVKFVQGLEEWVKLHLPESGHRMLNEKVLKAVADQLGTIKNDAC